MQFPGNCKVTIVLRVDYHLTWFTHIPPYVMRLKQTRFFIPYWWLFPRLFSFSFWLFLFHSLYRLLTFSCPLFLSLYIGLVLTIWQVGLRKLLTLVWEPWSMTQNSQLKFFSLLIIHLWDAHSDIQGGVMFSPLSNLRNPRWPPIWPSAFRRFVKAL